MVWWCTTCIMLHTRQGLCKEHEFEIMEIIWEKQGKERKGRVGFVQPGLLIDNFYCLTHLC